MEKLRESKKWVPGYVEVERLLKEARKIAEKKGKKEGKKEGEISKAIKMARKMKKKGYALKEIIDLTGLSKEEIKEL
jgi:predicted transposase/invertase (TIGR01784 family)